MCRHVSTLNCSLTLVIERCNYLTADTVTLLSSFIKSSLELSALVINIQSLIPLNQN